MLSDAAILFDALARYTAARIDFAKIIQLEEYRTPEGEKATPEEIQDAKDMRDRCVTLTDRAKTAMEAEPPEEESRIVTIN